MGKELRMLRHPWLWGAAVVEAGVVAIAILLMAHGSAMPENLQAQPPAHAAQQSADYPHGHVHVLVGADK